jgi:beta-glucosidase/6-phospho-beta-glucosidase/beta-galactosidase/glycosyltransferase involved in cell wall biosynthesis
MLQSGLTHGQAAADGSSEPSMQPAPTHSLPFQQFVWGAGIECSFLPHLDVDQFQWTQHDRFWREDLKRARSELGIQHLRYAFPWHKLQPQRGQFDWSYSDERMEEFKKLGINVFLDVMHFGTPLWLKQAVGDPEFPEALEQFTEALVSRYRGDITTWCPFNEPLVSALFSGDFGFWPPHGRKWRGYMPVLSRIVQAVSRGIRAIRRVMPEANILHVDNVESFKTRHQPLEIEVRRRNLRRFLVLDLLTGRVNKDHPLFIWLTSYGFSELDLEWFRQNPQMPDLLGLDYYSHSDWQLEVIGGSVQQRRADTPVGLYNIATAYYQRYGLPMMLTETSIEGQQINREIWFDNTIEDTRRLREEGYPMLGYFWWPMIDQLDWDGALTHRVGKIHQVGLFTLKRQSDGTLARSATPMVKVFRDAMENTDQRVGKLEHLIYPSESIDDQGPPIGVSYPESGSAPAQLATPTLVELPASGNGHSATHANGNGHAQARTLESAAARMTDSTGLSDAATTRATDRYGIVVFSHLRWGFVWQRPQQFLSRFARKHMVLFIEEPMFDLAEGAEPHYLLHRVMPNVVVSAPHLPAKWNHNPRLPEKLREFAHRAIEDMNEDGAFDKPLLWYYSPMDSAWSLGHFENRGVVYDSMDELSQFTGAPKALVANEERLMAHADIVFTGGYELWLKKKQRHDNVHFFGCGVEFDHFAKAQDPTTAIPADIDFMCRPILGWFGVVDERVDYAMVGEMARLRPNWSFAMVGPVVKVDPNHLPHAPNLFWLGGREYPVLPNYCRAFDICMMPFAINKATQYINPTKALEYFATGRPVISTPVKDVVRQYTGLVDIVGTAEEFVRAADQWLASPDPARLARCMERAKAGSWESTVQSMQELIKQAIGDKDRRSLRKVEPIEELELAYTYQATQGS